MKTGKTRPGVLLAGAAKIDITPDEPMFLGGYTLRSARSTGVKGRLYVRALVFDSGRQKFAIMMADLIGIEGEEVRRRIAEATGIPAGCIFAGDVHNHASPIPWRPKPGSKMKHLSNHRTAWFRHYNRSAVRVVQQALKNLQPVRMGWGQGRSRVGVNRRKPIAGGESILTFDENWASQTFGKHKTSRPVKILELPGVIRLGANPAGPIDEQVGVLRLDGLDGRPMAVLSNYACHGTSLGGRNGTVCGDWIGAAMTAIERETGAEAIFLQGASGDINPRVVGGLDGWPDSLAAATGLGEEYAQEVLRVGAGIMTAPPQQADIRVASTDILLPRAYRDLFSDFTQTVVKASTSAVRIGDCVWVNFPGEMFHQIGQRVRQMSPTPMTFLATCTNGSLGYMPTQQAYAEGGYEPGHSKLDPTAEAHYLRQAADLLWQLR